MSMSDDAHNLPLEVDMFKAALAHRVIEGNLALSTMPRLTPLIADNQGAVSAKLSFGKDIEGLYYIEGKLTCQLTVICQRCMQPMQISIKHSFMLSPAWTDQQAKILPEHYEPMMLQESDDRIMISDIIEDELILQLPLLPKHDVGECYANLETLGDNYTEEAKPNPFAVLARLKNK